MIAIILFMVVPRVAYAFDIREIPFKNDLTLSDLILSTLIIFEVCVKAFPKLKRYSALSGLYKVVTLLNDKKLNRSNNQSSKK
jgi:hypothetical protein